MKFNPLSKNGEYYKLKKDTWTEVTTNSGIVNKFFSVAVDKNLYTVDESGRMNPEKAWKLIHSILLNYFDEIESTDMASGFIQTPWKYKNYVENRRALRSRVSIRQTGIDDELVWGSGVIPWQSYPKMIDKR